MRRITSILAVVLIATFGLGAFGPVASMSALTDLGLGLDQAQAQKKGGGGKGGGKGGGASTATKAGERAGDLIRGWVGPVLIALIGVFALVALGKREIGMAVSATLIGLVAGLFVFAPEGAQSLFEDIYKAVF